jgi:hypothetical protein
MNVISNILHKNPLRKSVSITLTLKILHDQVCQPQHLDPVAILILHIFHALQPQRVAYIQANKYKKKTKKKHLLKY